MNLPEDVRKDIECPVCLQIPRETPIFQCDNGHIICKDCKPRLELCPQCRTFVGNSRNLIAERIVSKIKHKCKFAEDGCDKEVLFEGLQDHEKRCNFHPLQCVKSDCEKLINRSQYLSHMRTDHRATFWSINYLLESIRGQLEKHVGVLEANSQFFLVVTEVQSGFLVKYIFILGSQEDRVKYTCSVNIGTLASSNQYNRTIIQQCTGYINVVGEPVRIPCFTMHPAQLKQYNDDTENTYYLSIVIDVVPGIPTF